MASVKEVQAGITLANEKASESIAALQQASTALEEARVAFVRATEGSDQAEIQQTNGLLSQAIASITDARNSVEASISTAEDYSSRL